LSKAKKLAAQKVFDFFEPFCAHLQPKFTKSAKKSQKNVSLQKLNIGTKKF
jgi:hypothetical protein